MTRIAVVVPTLNAERTLDACLRSIRAQTVPSSIVVVDYYSTDATVEIARRHADVVVADPPRSDRPPPFFTLQRNLGAAQTDAEVLAFIDADMVLAPTVLAESLQQLDAGADAVIVPERTVGRGFWARVRAFERSFYVGSDVVESARVFARWCFDAVGGYDEWLPASEDRDLHLRVAKIARIGRIRSFIDHDEDGTTFRRLCRKKGQYAVGMAEYVIKKRSLDAALSVRRPYLVQPWRLLVPHPILGLSLLALKTGELTAVAYRLARWRRESRRGAASAAIPRTLRNLAEATVAVGIPAYGEGERITEALESAWSAAGQARLRDVAFLLSDSSPAEDTVAAARRWAERRGVSLCVDRSPVRRTVKEALNVLFAMCSADFLVVVDADVNLDRAALEELFTALLASPSRQVAVGVTLPDRRYRGLNRRAARWQLNAATRMARLLPDTDVRAEGALWVARRGFYESFRFTPGEGSLAGDVELRAALRRSHAGATAKRAVAYKVPAAGVRDFALGYLRGRAAVSYSSSQRPALRAGLRQALADPLGAVMYLVYRVRAERLRPRLSAATAEQWERPWSTVHPGGQRR